MIFTWEPEDIVTGLHICQPEKGTKAVIGWLGSGGGKPDRRFTITELNTDGKIHGQHRENTGGTFEVDDTGALTMFTFTREELAYYLNNQNIWWIPTSLIEGNGQRLRFELGKGTMRPCMAGTRTWKDV